MTITNHCIQDLFKKQVQATPNQIAVITGTNSISYKELDEQSSFFAHDLIIKYNLKPKDILAIHIENSIDLIVALVGVLKVGATYVPLDCAYPLERKTYMVNNAGARLVICSFQSPLHVDGIPSINIEERSLTHSKPLDLTHHYSLQDHLYILYTSGSTGKPKGVPLRQAGVVNMLNWYCSDFQMSTSDINLIFSSFAYDLTQKNILSALICGATIVFYDAPGYQPNVIIDYIEKYKVTIINSTPSAFYPLIDFAKNIQQLSSLKWIFLGGEKINCQRILPLTTLYPSTKVVNTYGPTECSDVVCSYILSKEDILSNQNVPLGKIIKNAGVLVLDENLNVISDDKPGEVYLFGICVGDGYINQLELTKERFIDAVPPHLKEMGINRLYRVGDIGYWDKEGRLNFIGRTDDQVKLRGNRVELSEIDKVLEQEAEIKQAVTVMIEKNQRQVLVSFYLSNEPINHRLLKDKISRFLPAHMLPNDFVHLTDFPLTPNAKVDKHVLKKIANEIA